jgi:hypothetical protein
MSCLNCVAGHEIEHQKAGCKYQDYTVFCVPGKMVHGVEWFMGSSISIGAELQSQSQYRLFSEPD